MTRDERIAGLIQAVLERERGVPVQVEVTGDEVIFHVDGDATATHSRLTPESFDALARWEEYGGTPPTLELISPSDD